MHRSWSFRFLLLCAALAGYGDARAQIVFVGPANDPACTYHSVQEAVNAWAASNSTETLSVFIAHGQAWTTQAITIPTPLVPHPLNLRGDYAGCALGGPTGRATLDGAGGAAAPVIDIVGNGSGDAGRFEVTLMNLEIIGGDVAGDGGGVRLRGNAVLTLFDSVLRNNQAQRGGGLALSGTAAGEPRLILGGNASPATFRNNLASGDGGGLYCNDASIYCDRYCLIQSNHAGGNGGGLAQENCDTLLYPPDSAAPFDPLVGVRGNTTDGDGGGAWISGGRFDLRGGQTPAPLVGNEATGSGGGLYFTAGAGGGGQAVQFDDNRAGGSGGGLASIGGGFLIFDSAPSGKRCKDGLEFCARFRGNEALGEGGAIRLASGDLLLGGALLDGNRAARGSVLDLAGTAGGATLTNVHIAGNSLADELVYADDGYLDLRYVTIADNGSDDTALIRFAAPAQLTARNTILHDDNGAGSGVVLASAPGSTFLVSCVLVHEGASLSGLPGVGGVAVGAPQWDTSGSYPAGLFVPGPDSAAVDACDAGPGNVADLLETPRPQDTARPNGAGAFDMGALERFVVPLVFRNGFEGPP
jgi:predicted outer membrane repeat protein